MCESEFLCVFMDNVAAFVYVCVCNSVCNHVCICLCETNCAFKLKCSVETDSHPTFPQKTTQIVSGSRTYQIWRWSSCFGLNLSRILTSVAPEPAAFRVQRHAGILEGVTVTSPCLTIWCKDLDP